MNPLSVETNANLNRVGRSESGREQNSPAKNQLSSAAKSTSSKARANTPSPSSSSAEPREIAFQLSAPSAKAVMLAGEFTEWDKSPVKMIKGGGGNWHVKMSLPPGRHAYRFLVDGQWQNDPVAHERVPNPFGSFNNVVEVS